MTLITNQKLQNLRATLHCKPLFFSEDGFDRTEHQERSNLFSFCFNLFTLFYVSPFRVLNLKQGFLLFHFRFKKKNGVKNSGYLNKAQSLALDAKYGDQTFQRKREPSSVLLQEREGAVIRGREELRTACAVRRRRSPAHTLKEFSLKRREFTFQPFPGVENVQCIRLMWEDLVSTGELESLATLTNLRMLQIKGKIDNHVQLPRHLKWLDLERASIDDSSLLHLTELVILRLVNVRSGELLPFNKSLDKLEVLVLDNWGELIASPDFNYFPNLKKLEYIGCSGVKKVAGHVMNRFMDLLMLQITRRRTCWEEIPATVGNLTSLRELRIRGASIQGLPDSITQLPNLTDLSLSECFRLKKLPDAMGCLTALSTLDLGRCTALEDLPDSIGELQSLKTLELRGTKFKRLPDFIGSLKRLSQLDLSSCDVWEDLPDSIGQLESLKTLKLGGTKFERLPDFIGSLKRLSQLDLSGCDVLEEIPDSIAQLSNLTDLSLENCGRLKKLPDAMGCLTALSTLNLRGCTTLEDLPDSIRTLKTLKRLDFYGNDIDGAKEPPLINLR